MKDKKKYLFIGLLSMFVLNITDIFTTFWNDPTLKSEVNPIFLKYDLNAYGLLIILIGFQLLNSLLFYYHAWVFKGYYFKSDSKNVVGFFKIISWKGQEPNQYLLDKLKNILRSILNIYGFYCFLSYIISKSIISTHNFLLALLSNNSTYVTDPKTHIITITRNDNRIWDYVLGDWIIDYNIFSIKNINVLFSIHNQIQTVLTSVCLVFFFFYLLGKYWNSTNTEINIYSLANQEKNSQAIKIKDGWIVFLVVIGTLILNIPF